MKLVAIRIVIALVGIIVVAAPAQAQRRRMRGGRAVLVGRSPEVGAHLGYNFDLDETAIGAQASFPVEPSIDFYPSFDYYTVSNGTVWALNFDLRWRPPSTYGAWYVGTGLDLLHSSGGTGTSDTKAHLNVLGGVEGQARGFRPFAEARLILGNGSQFQIVGGVSFPIH